MQPVVKWAGGKRQLLSKLKPLIPASYHRYVEPFAGGLALLLNLEPKRALVNDYNTELINLYQVIRQHLAPLLIDLALHENSPEYYYALRNLDRDEQYAQLSAVKRASRLLYLNRTCYNGLYRVNQSGHFNTPYGHYKKPLISPVQALQTMHGYFNRADINFSALHFQQFFEQTALIADDFVYLDPPYDVEPRQSGFVSYQAGGFGRDEQLQLKQICDTLTNKGVKFLLSNSATPFIIELYGAYKLEQVMVKRSIAAAAQYRGGVAEVLVRNY